MAFGVITEWLARIEHKLDILLRSSPGANLFQLHFKGSVCPVCLRTIDYQIDISNNVVTRRCGCATGISPSVIPLLPVEQKGMTSGSGNAAAPAPVDPPERG